MDDKTTMMRRMTTMRVMMTMIMGRRMTTILGTASRKPADRRDPSEEPEHGESFLVRAQNTSV